MTMLKTEVAAQSMAATNDNNNSSNEDKSTNNHTIVETENQALTTKFNLKTTMSKEERIKHALDFLNILYQNVTTTRYTCLCAGTDGFYPDSFYDVSIPQQRQEMAKRAISLNDEGENIALNVNLMDKIPPKKDNGKLARGGAKDITTQVAIVSDIDTEGGRHISTEGHVYTPSTEVAIGYAPIPPSLIVNSGYGVHLYNLLSQPVEFTTDEQRKNVKEHRNKAYISIIKDKAKEMGYNEGVDSVDNLDRILRMPGTYNYKGDKTNPPLCQYESFDVRYTAEEFDSKIKPFIPGKNDKPKVDKDNVTPTTHSLDYGQDAEFDLYRAKRMLEYIDSYYEDKWAKVCAYLKNIANLGHLSENDALNLFDEWSATSPAQYNKPDDHGNTGRAACEAKWDNSTMGGDWGNLYGLAKENGYNANDVTRDWYNLKEDKEYQVQKDEVADILQKSRDKNKPAQVDDKLSIELDKSESDDDDDFTIVDYLRDSLKKDQEDYGKHTTRKTGFNNLDTLMGGFPPGVYILAAINSNGKTAFTIQLGIQLAEQGENVITVGFEMTRLAITSRILAKRTREINPNSEISSFDIRKGSCDDDPAYQEALSWYLKSNLNFKMWKTTEDDTIPNLIKRIKKHIGKHPNDKRPVVIIDYLQIIPHQSDVKTMLDKDLPKLKRLQDETNSTFIIVSSTNRASYRHDMSVEAFKESGIIEFSADVIWGLQYTALDELNDNESKGATNKQLEDEKARSPRIMTLKCLKQRNGVDYRAYFKYYSKYDLFEESTKEENEKAVEYSTRPKSKYKKEID